MKMENEVWKKQRLGFFTASEIAVLLKPKGFGDTGNTYIFKKAAEKLGAQENEIYSKYIDWGKDWEYTAKLWYQNLFRKEISDIEFIKHPKLEAGCTPDGWIHSDMKGLELKCPETIDKHIKVGIMRDEKELLSYNDKYYWQCKMSMFIMNCNEWDFCSFDPRHEDKYKMFCLTLRRNEKEDLFLSERIKLATEMRDEIIDKIMSIY